MPLISVLRQNGAIEWYSFLRHDRDSGVPTTADDGCAYFHVRIAFAEDVDPESVLVSLPDYCTMTRKIRIEQIHRIADIDRTLLKNEDIGEAWRIIGEQSECVLNMLTIHKPDVDIPAIQMAQFLHFFANMT